MEIQSSDIAPWNIAESDSEGSPRVIRYRTDLEPFIGHHEYCQRLVIVWEYDIDNTSGLPSSELSDEMREFEDKLVPELDKGRLAILAFVYTHEGIREWHFYIRDLHTLADKINVSLKDLPKLPITIQVEDDPEWEQISLVYSICR